MASLDLGANSFTFTGEHHHITYINGVIGPVTPGEESGRLTYVGPEGTFTFQGKEINLQENLSLPGTLLTIRLAPQNGGLIGDVGEVTFTIILPGLSAIKDGKPLTFHTLAIKASTVGNINVEGAKSTYQSLRLRAEARNVVLPLSNKQS